MNSLIKDFNALITFDQEAFDLYGHKVWIPSQGAITRLLKNHRATLVHYCTLAPLHHYTAFEHRADALHNLTEAVAENIRSRRLNGLND